MHKGDESCSVILDAEGVKLGKCGTLGKSKRRSKDTSTPLPLDLNRFAYVLRRYDVSSLLTRILLPGPTVISNPGQPATAPTPEIDVTDGVGTYLVTFDQKYLPASLTYNSRNDVESAHVEYADYVNIGRGLYPRRIDIKETFEGTQRTFSVKVNTVRPAALPSAPRSK